MAYPVVQEGLNHLFNAHLMGDLIVKSGINGYLFILHLQGNTLLAL